MESLCVGNRYLVWLPASNAYYWSEAPVFETFKMLEQELSDKEICDVLSAKYGITKSESLSFLEELKSVWQKKEVDLSMGPKASQWEHFKRNDSISKCYKFFDRLVSISYHPKELTRLLHPQIAHLEVSGPPEPGVTYHEIQLMEKKGIYTLFHGQSLIGTWEEDSQHLFRGSVLFKLLQVIHEKGEKEWVATFHAAAITDTKHSLLIPAISGSGKSTFSALIHHLGYHCVAEDLTAVSLKEKFAAPFPGAFSIKQGSYPLVSEFYPELKDQAWQDTVIGKRVKYLPLRYNLSREALTKSIRAVLFLKYEPKTLCSLSELEKLEGIPKLFSETFIPPYQKNVKELFNWIPRLRYFQLTYSDIHLAKSELDKIFASF